MPEYALPVTDPTTGEDISNLPRITVRPAELPVDPYSGNPQFNNISEVPQWMKKLTGTGGEERYQMWPERMVRSGFSLPEDVIKGNISTERDPVTGSFDPELIGRVQDMSGLAGMSSIPLATKGSLGAIGGKFYSTLEKTIGDSKVQKATPEQWTNYLKNQPGVKPEELEFAGLDKLSGVVTKDELLAHTQENGIKMGEVWKGNTADFKRWKELDDKAIRTPEERIEYSELSKNGQITEPKFSSYQLPGGENYRELLLTTPKQENYGVKLAEGGYRIYDYKNNDFVRTPDGKVRTSYQTKEEANLAAEGLNKTSGNNPMGNYQSSHWDEPNVLAHIRMNDRFIPDPNGPSIKKGEIYQPIGHNKQSYYKPDEKGLKTLHVEEIQSDWHQAGRKQGYKDENKLAELNNRLDILNEQIMKSHEREKYRELVNERDKLNEEWNVIRNDTVPNAPFKKTWDELALKRVLTEAVNNNYDAVSWTPGEAQAARYDLSKQLDELVAIKNKDGSYKLQGTIKGGGNHQFGDNIAENKLPDFVGKEMAEKISKQDIGPEVYDGDKLKIGGEGMKGFYDTMLPAKANALIKKMGGKVEYENLPPTKAQREKFENEHGPDKIAQEKYGKEWDDLVKERDKYWQIINKYQKDNHAYNAAYEKYKEFDDKLDSIHKKMIDDSLTRAKGDKIPIIKITPEMRKIIAEKGFPLYSAGVPTFTPVDGDPHKPKLTKVDHNPFKMTPINYNPFELPTQP